MIPRRTDEVRLTDALAFAPVVVLSGPRQAGKSTLARLVVDTPESHRFDLEDPGDRARLAEPMLSLGGLKGTVVIDEAQRAPTCSRSSACSSTAIAVLADSWCSAAHPPT